MYKQETNQPANLFFFCIPNSYMHISVVASLVNVSMKYGKPERTRNQLWIYQILS
jgi:hypothetical protein